MDAKNFHGVGFQEFDFEKYRAQLRKMADDDLLMHGEMLSRLSSPEQDFGNPLNEQWVQQLNECREEWKRRRQSRRPMNSLKTT